MEQEQEQDTPPATPDVAATEVERPLRETTVYRRGQDSGYSLRRMIYVFSTTVFLLLADTGFVALHYTGDLVTKFVDGSFSLMSAIALYYLGAGILDKSEFLRRLGDSFGRRRDGDGDGDKRDGDGDRK
jgi:hypothetical protein